MIKLHQFHTCWGLPNASPFCMKLETYLRMINQPFEIVTVANPGTAPKGKLPFINDNGVIIADSDLVITYLKSKYGDTLDNNLTPHQRALSITIQRTLEDHLYWCMIYSRWVDDKNWPETKNTFFAKVPSLLRSYISNSVRKRTQAALFRQGLGRHNSEEIYQMGIKDLSALTTLLGDNNFMLGDMPSSIDAATYAFLVNLIHAPTVSPINEYAKSQQNFIEYCARMKSLYYQPA